MKKCLYDENKSNERCPERFCFLRVPCFYGKATLTGRIRNENPEPQNIPVKKVDPSPAL